MTTLPVLEVLRLYLDNRISLNQVQDWLAQAQAKVSGRDEELVDDLISALAHLHDGFIDEKGFRDWATYLLEREQDNIIPITMDTVGLRLRRAPGITKVAVSGASTTADRGEIRYAAPAAA